MTDIGRQLGYSAHSSFSHAFSRIMGESPGRYRRRELPAVLRHGHTVAGPARDGPACDVSGSWAGPHPSQRGWAGPEPAQPPLRTALSLSTGRLDDRSASGEIDGSHAGTFPAAVSAYTGST